MDEIRLAFLGFGSANQALARMILDKSISSFEGGSSRRYYLRIPSSSPTNHTSRLVPWKVVCIITKRHGFANASIDQQENLCSFAEDESDSIQKNVGGGEIDVVEALQRMQSGKMLDNSLVLGSQRDDKNVTETLKFNSPLRSNDTTISTVDANNEQTQKLLELLGESQTANIVVEAIPSNPCTGEPAISFLTTALQSNMHVVSANKGPLAHSILSSCDDESKSDNKCVRQEAYCMLQNLAHQNKVMYLHESAVMDGVPIFSLWKYTLPHARLLSLRGCLNSTTTMILTRMEGQLDNNQGVFSGESFDDALEAAKKMGIVEEDESLDVDGYDAAVKLRAILVVVTSYLSSSDPTCRIIIPPIEKIARDSIRNVSREDILRAYSDGRKKYRLVASAEIVDTKEEPDNKLTESRSWNARVKLELLPPDDPLYNLSGTSSSVEFCTDVLGPISVVSKDPTLVDTAYGLFSDIVRVASESR